MNILVTGVKGQLGFDMVKEIKARGNYTVTGIDYEDLDITNKESVIRYFDDKKYDVLVHCAAYTAVDKAEEEEEKELCFRVNVEGTKNLLDIAKQQSAKFVLISTDYVFDGNKDGIYEVDDLRNPISVYGSSKKEAEDIVSVYDKCFIVRTSWVYGYNGHNFVKTMLKLAENKDLLNVINDQIGSPTYTVDLAKLLCDMIDTNKYGVYHGTNEEFCSWFEFASKIFEYTNKSIDVNPIPTSEYPTKATRPLNSRLDKSKLVKKGFSLMPTWQDALRRFLIELGEIKQ